MAINRGPWTALVDDDGSNTVGSLWNKAAIATVLLDPIDAALAPLATAPWIDVPWEAANFGAAAGAWTVTAGQQVTYATRHAGAALDLQLYVTGTTLSASTATVTVWVPRGLVWRHSLVHPGRAYLGGAWEGVNVLASAGLQYLTIGRGSGAPFPAGALDLALALTLAL